ncbi:MAG: alpha/beta fold hydrolase [Cyanobacteria bacterium SZAS TMP-1]|nr:alpha/beta fold hydrolase [Cyanobacteria bacterium SZAS TMP-1]
MKTISIRPLLSVILTLGAVPLMPLTASAQTAIAANPPVKPLARPTASVPSASTAPGPKGILGRPPSAYKMDQPQEKIPCLRWADETVKPKAILFCIHGLGLHKGCYEDFGKAMAKQGLIVYAIDVRGFGEWVKKEKNDKVDFDGTLSDIRRALVQVRSKNPGLPVIVLGESMGGGIGIHATAQFPELIDGLISSVPAGERYGAGEEKLKVGMHAIFGMGKKMDVGSGVIKQATKKEDLRERWANDPLGRKDLSPAELIAFQSFMNKNIDEAARIKSTPVLVIQGAEDKLVIPASTVKLYNSIASYQKSKVLSRNAEHLIFEEGQFTPEDLAYVTNWIDKKIIAKSDDKDTATTASNSGNASGESSTTDSAPPISIHIKPTTPVASAAATAPSAQATTPALSDGPSISYWIELYRGGKVYRCNNKIAFQSGDAIRFHIIPKTDGYAYLLMKQGSSGKRAILFPSAKTGNDNYLKAGSDYPVPSADWLSFDNTPGIEKVSILFSHKKMLTGEELKEPTNLAFVSNDRSGAKDLVPTRMQLSWDDPTPVILPDVIAPSAPGARQSMSTSENGSLVKVSFNDPSGLLAVDVALAHQ